MNDSKKLSEFIGKGSEIAGSATGCLLGFIAGGPIGAAVGGAAAPIFTMGLKAIGDYAQRVLSERESCRIAGVSALSINNIKERIDNGESLRSDSFFENDGFSNSSAYEIFEGMLLKARSDHEERKLPLYAHLFESVCFDPSISSDNANWIVQLLDNFTYRHFEILYCFIELNEESKWIANDIHALAKEHPFIAACITELQNYQLLTQSFWGDSPVKISEFGARLIKIIQFSKVKSESYREVYDVLK